MRESEVEWSAVERAGVEWSRRGRTGTLRIWCSAPVKKSGVERNGMERSVGRAERGEVQ